MNYRRLSVVILLWFAGCSGSGNPPVKPAVIIQGKIVNGGQPIPAPRADVGFGLVEITLFPEGSSPGSVETATAKADGSFEILGLGKGVPPGNYKLAVSQRDQEPGSAAATALDAFSKENTPIKIQVPDTKVGGRFNLEVIDLSTYAKK